MFLFYFNEKLIQKSKSQIKEMGIRQRRHGMTVQRYNKNEKLRKYIVLEFSPTRLLMFFSVLVPCDLSPWASLWALMLSRSSGMSERGFFKQLSSSSSTCPFLPFPKSLSPSHFILTVSPYMSGIIRSGSLGFLLSSSSVRIISWKVHSSPTDGFLISMGIFLESFWG